VFAESIGKPVCQARSPQVVKCPVRNASSFTDSPELAIEIVKGSLATLNTPFAPLSELLYVVVPCCRNGDVGASLGLLGLLFG